MSGTKIRFGKIFWPSLVASLVVSIIILIISILIATGIIGGLSDMKPKPLRVKDGSILEMNLNGAIKERPNSNFDPMSFNFDRQISLSHILHGLESAADDKKIRGIFMDVSNLSCGYATANEIRRAIEKFKESGKFVVAYNEGEVITQKEYFLASVADEVYGFPSSAFQFVGVGAELMFFKGALDKLDVEMQVIRGKNNHFKSAVEPYFRKDMSDSARHQTETFLADIWKNIITEISTSREVSVSELNTLADQADIRRASHAKKAGLLDDVLYRDEVMKLLADKVSEDKVEDLKLVSFAKYSRKKFHHHQVLMQNDKANMAVVLAQGGITVDGDELTSKDICEQFRKIRRNETIQTVVFRVNSPGGSALASEEIWREVYLTNKEKPVIISMGDYAASGGYYISTPATVIFADPVTITGSIGVFGVIPFTGSFFENKLGLSFDRVSTNKHAVMSTNKKLNEEEMEIIQSEVDQIYQDFLNHVAKGRDLSMNQVNQIARGRVWTGEDAKQIGLVDELGGLKDAIEYAKEKAEISEAKILYYPKRKDSPLMQIVETLEEKEKEDKETTKKTEDNIPQELLKQYRAIKKLEQYSGIQMRLPLEMELE